MALPFAQHTDDVLILCFYSLPLMMAASNVVAQAQFIGL